MYFFVEKLIYFLILSSQDADLAVAAAKKAGEEGSEWSKVYIFMYIYIYIYIQIWSLYIFYYINDKDVLY